MRGSHHDKADLLVWAVLLFAIGAVLLSRLFIEAPVGYAAGIIRVEGFSMEPTLHNGGFYVVLQKPYESLKRGDVVEYRNPVVKVAVVHRIVSGWSPYWVAKGDANAYPDRGYVTPTNYIGTIVCP